jgi:hypothetical protein
MMESTIRSHGNPCLVDTSTGYASGSKAKAVKEPWKVGLMKLAQFDTVFFV